MVFNIKSLLVPVGEIDLEMLSELRLKHPEVTVDNEVVEPSAQQLHNYRGTAYTYLAYHKFILCLCIHMRPQNMSIFNLTANNGYAVHYFSLYF